MFHSTHAHTHRKDLTKSLKAGSKTLILWFIVKSCYDENIRLKKIMLFCHKNHDFLVVRTFFILFGSNLIWLNVFWHKFIYFLFQGINHSLSLFPGLLCCIAAWHPFVFWDNKIQDSHSSVTMIAGHCIVAFHNRIY